MTPAETENQDRAASAGNCAARRVLLVLGAAALIVGLVGAGLQIRTSGQQDRSEQAAGSGNPRLASLEAAVRKGPEDAAAWAELGAAYVDHARVNSDPSAYPKAERALKTSLKLQPEGNWEALAASGALAAGRHDFGPALEFSSRARELQPQSPFILGVMVDALTELGRYPEAVEAAQAMVDLRPDLASYARVSYQRELHGDVPGAIEAMELALRAASGADRSFALYYLGELEWNRGEIDAAGERYRQALRADPTAAQATAGLGKVAAARGDIDAAIRLYTEAADSFPDPDILKELGELHLVKGDSDAAEKMFERSAESNAEQAAGGVHVDLETALFSADHRHNLSEGLSAARREWDRRESIHVADAVAWQLLANGQAAEALPYADKALQLGTKSATFHFHRAEIHRALGNDAAAIRDYQAALDINPHFSFIFSDDAERALVSLSA